MKKIWIVFTCLAFTACNKFLDEKNDKKLVIPATLTDLQAVLDNTNTIVLNDPYADELSSDNFYLTTAVWQAQPDYDRGFYIWQKDNDNVPNPNDWSNLYRKVYCANTVLETLTNIERSANNKTEWDNLKGQALMIRGKAFLQAVLLWSPAYDAATAGAELGIPLRLSSDFAETSTRPSVQQSFDQVIADLTASVALLPNRGVAVNRSCKAAAYGLLSRCYLYMRQYNKAGLYADSSLQINNALLNYNTLSTTATYSLPLPATNPEIDVYCTAFTSSLAMTNAKIDTILYNSYNANDYRKTILFKINSDGSIAFKGSHTGAAGHFTGVASDEMYLNRAECFARGGNTAAAMNYINSLLKMRYKTNLFAPLAASSSAEALDIILKERRKELIQRGLRWMDIKRLNKEGAGIVQKRIINNAQYLLPANDLRYALQIPAYVISLSGMPQNAR